MLCLPGKPLSSRLRCGTATWSRGHPIGLGVRTLIPSGSAADPEWPGTSSSFLPPLCLSFPTNDTKGLNSVSGFLSVFEESWVFHDHRRANYDLQAKFSPPAHSYKLSLIGTQPHYLFVYILSVATQRYHSKEELSSWDRSHITHGVEGPKLPQHIWWFTRRAHRMQT